MLQAPDHHDEALLEMDYFEIEAICLFVVLSRQQEVVLLLVSRYLLMIFL